ncbi:MAG: hypothetical protein H6724_15600 [Sandaracinus sp.]|nr:hypothetical protein [Sandaracinus sp.]
MGQYLTPEPMATEGATRWSSYGYALEAPFDYVDPDGRLAWPFSGRPLTSCDTAAGAPLCAAGIAGGSALGTAGGGTAAAGAGATGGAVAGGLSAPTVGEAIGGAICVAMAASASNATTANPPRTNNPNTYGCLLDKQSSGPVGDRDTGNETGLRGGMVNMACVYDCRDPGSVFGASRVVSHCTQGQSQVCPVEFEATKADLLAALSSRGCYVLPWWSMFFGI